MIATETSDRNPRSQSTHEAPERRRTSFTKSMVFMNRSERHGAPPSGAQITRNASDSRSG
jgi:hypothetical protein